MKKLTGLLLFGVAALLITLPLSAMGAGPEQNMKRAGHGLASDRMIGSVFAEDLGFWRINVVKSPVQPLTPVVLNNAVSIARRPPINLGPWTPPPWWTPPRRPPWASPHF